MNLKVCRAQKLISQKELAEKLGVSKNTISRWETGRIEPNINTLIKLSEILEVSIDFLITGRSVKYESQRLINKQ